MGAEIFGWFVFLLSVITIGFSIFYPIYLWKFKKVRRSKVFLVARAIRVVFGVVVIIVTIITAYQSASLNAEIVGGFIGRGLIAYLLIRRWAPKELNS